MNYIYIIENKITGHLYIGRTKDASARKRDHFYKLKGGRHKNHWLQRAFIKYGASAFEFRVVDEAPEDQIHAKEIEWFDKYGRDKDKLYNAHFESYGGPIIFGLKPSDETNRKKAATRESKTRVFIFDILDDKFKNNLTTAQLRKKYGVHPETLTKFTLEWEQMRGLKMPNNMRHLESKEKVARLVDAYRKIGASVFNRHREYGLALKTVLHYLPDFGLSEAQLQAEGWRRQRKDKCTHCGKEAGAIMIARWHNDNCKHKA